MLAHPDGSLSWSQSLRPVRVRQGDSWRGVDLTLARRADGVVAPVAAPVDLRLSGGGTSSPLVVLGRDGREIGLGWAGALPEPVLSGPTATYPNVLPDVDLVVTVDVTGFSQVLVVKSREAAKNPAIRSLVFPVTTRNSTLGTEPGEGRGQLRNMPTTTRAAGEPDGLVVRDAEGRTVFSGDATRMWDSTGPEGGRAAGPSDANREAVMGLAVSERSVTVTPDAALLDSPGTTYPVYVDPEFWHGGKNHHVVVQDGQQAGTLNYDRTSFPLNDLKSGYHLENGAFRSRAFVEMNTDFVRGRKIHGAVLRANVIHSNSCAGAIPTVVGLTSPIDPHISWNRQPVWQYDMGSSNVTNNQSYCPSNGWAEFDATRAAADSAQQGWTNVTLGLRGDEGRVDGWRRFGFDLVLVIRYNSYPHQPSQLLTRVDSLNVGCVTGAARPYSSDARPRLSAFFGDDDGSLLNAKFEWTELSTGATGHTGAGEFPPRTVRDVEVPAGAMRDGGIYSWRVQAGDGELLSPWSGTCEVAIDTTKPGLPSVTPVQVPQYEGLPATLTLGANGTPDVVRYVYTTDAVDPTPIGSPSVNANGLGGDATIRVTAQQGETTVRVRSVDRANNPGEIFEFKFKARDKASVVSEWRLDRALDDAAAQRRPLSYAGTGAAAWTPGYVGDALAMNPATRDHAVTAQPAVDTGQSFAVSAWVKLSRGDGWYTVASQEGSRVGSFFLQYRPDTGRWTFRAPLSDVDGADSDAVPSTGPALLNTWTHLAGVYDEPAKKLRLYVNGVLQGETPHTGWNAGGPFLLGAAKWSGARVDFFPGAIDNVQVWNRVVFASEAAAMNNIAVPRAAYALNEGTGTTAKDSVTGGSATLRGDVGWSTSDYRTAKLSGHPSGWISGPRPDIRAGQSYTVSAWVRANALDASARTAVSFGDPKFSPFLLGYHPGQQRWELFSVNAAGTASWSAVSIATAAPNTWVHLTGVYDAVAREIRLYVNGQLSNKQTGVEPWGGGADGLSIGAGQWNSQPTGRWNGLLDDVRVYAGVVDEPAIRDFADPTLRS
ncbi:concanavalin A-like lectin/glucanase superfamily protein [Herbihabitans rhizosphaerae]|uniref:Concanavalin A-like lectin/glucanase superfamily protein n=1 Tax=Herbihabitans rhizosphaerae TaxID=1872711 RepID=A0A4V2ES53_9PSEU|nr:concanavalin A-like lectin/glucanase superfamily protein [Herbihabitans rhizosphaerae]